MKKVLIVDDEVDLCLLIRQTLRKKNYEVHIAHTLSEGVKKMNAFHPDTLLLDNNLPDGFGWDMAEAIKNQFPEMNITLISAHRTDIDFKDEQERPVKILEKPLSLVDIENYIWYFSTKYFTNPKEIFPR